MLMTATKFYKGKCYFLQTQKDHQVKHYPTNEKVVTLSIGSG